MRVAVSLCLVSLAVLTGCPPTGVECRAGTVACGAGCIDPSSDKRNCGGCGIACGAGQQCNEGVCECEPGTALCNGECVVRDFDPRHCGMCGKLCAAGGVCTLGVCGCPTGQTDCSGACVSTSNDVRNCGLCGKACASGEVCDLGTCKQSCTAPAVLCNGSCANLATDAMNCGTCGRACAPTQACVASECACPAGQQLCGTLCIDTSSSTSHCGACNAACGNGMSCRASTCTFDVVAACYWSGQVVGFNTTTFSKGSLTDLGTNPFALGVKSGVVLALDGQDRRMNQAVLSRDGLAQASVANVTGAVPNQVLVDGANLYVVNASSGTLQVLTEAADAGRITLDAGVAGGLALGTVSELNFGMNSYPQGVARVGDSLWIPLYGGFGAAAADAGQAVVKVPVANPTTETTRVSLKALDLHAFDGGSPVARPWAITAHGGAVYVVLNNLNPDSYAPEGPGMLARIDPVANTATGIDLGAAQCLNPQWAASVGSLLAVSCGGKVTYDANFSVLGVTAAGVVLVGPGDQVVSSWSSACPADAGTCAPMIPSRFTVRGSRVVLGDQNAGRVVVLEVTDGGLSEVRGLANALSTCPISATTGAGNVSDLVSLP